MSENQERPRRTSSEVAELPKGTIPRYGIKLQSIVTSKDKERKIGPAAKALSDPNTVKTLMQRGVVPDYYVSFLIKVVYAKMSR